MTTTTQTTTLVQDFIWYSNPVILLSCAFGLIRSRLRKNFPVFFTYLIFTAAASYAMVPVTHIWGFNSYPSFYTWLGMNFVSVALSFIVLYEVLRNVMTSGTVRFSVSTFVLIISLLVIAGTILSMTLKADNDLPGMTALFIVSNVLRIAQIGLLLVMVVLTIFFGCYWRDLAFGISAGFGTYAGMEIARVYVRAQLGPQGNHFTNLVSQWSYEIASLIWLLYIFKGPKRPSAGLPADRAKDFELPVKEMLR